MLRKPWHCNVIPCKLEAQKLLLFNNSTDIQSMKEQMIFRTLQSKEFHFGNVRTYFFLLTTKKNY